jgi:hypothetical protein
MKNLYESILDNTKSKVSQGVKQIARVSSVPKAKDFKKTFNRFQQYVVWECKDLIKEYKRKYPEMVDRDYTELLFMIDTRHSSIITLEIFLCVPEARQLEQSENVNCTVTVNGRARRKLLGWYDRFFDGVKDAKNQTINLITKLAEDEKLLDKVFEHSAKLFKENGEKGFFSGRDYKTLQYDL